MRVDDLVEGSITFASACAAARTSVRFVEPGADVGIPGCGFRLLIGPRGRHSARSSSISWSSFRGRRGPCRSPPRSCRRRRTAGRAFFSATIASPRRLLVGDLGQLGERGCRGFRPRAGVQGRSAPARPWPHPRQGHHRPCRRPRPRPRAWPRPRPPRRQQGSPSRRSRRAGSRAGRRPGHHPRPRSPCRRSAPVPLPRAGCRPRPRRLPISLSAMGLVLTWGGCVGRPGPWVVWWRAAAGLPRRRRRAGGSGRLLR